MGRLCNEAGRVLIKNAEGVRLVAYYCPAGKLTIGYGSTGRHVMEGMTITAAEAEELLAKDLAIFEAGVEARLEETTTTDNEFSSMVSLAFNIGLKNFGGSSVLRHHRSGDKSRAADSFLLWNKATVNGKKVVMPGLVKRREAERALYLS